MAKRDVKGLVNEAKEVAILDAAMRIKNGWRRGSYRQYYAQILWEESILYCFLTNLLFFFAGYVTVAMTYYLISLQCVILESSAHSIKGEARIGTTMEMEACFQNEILQMESA